MLRYTDPDVAPADTLEPGPDCHHITHVYVGLVEDPTGAVFPPHECGHESLAIFYTGWGGGRRLDVKHGLSFTGDAEAVRRIYRDDFRSDDVPIYRLARCETGEAFKAELGCVLKEFPDLQEEDPDGILKKMPDFFPDELSGGPLPDLTSLYRRGIPEEFDWLAEHFSYHVLGSNDSAFDAWVLAQEFDVVAAHCRSGEYYIVYQTSDADGEAMAKSVAEEYLLMDDGYVFGWVLGMLDHPDEAVFDVNGGAKPCRSFVEWDSSWGYVGRPKDLKSCLYDDARGAMRRRGYLPEDVRVLDERSTDITAEVLASYEPPPLVQPTPGLDYDTLSPERDLEGLCQSP